MNTSKFKDGRWVYVEGLGQEYTTTVEDAFTGLHTWGDFYKAVETEYKTLGGDLDLALRTVLSYPPYDYLGRWCKQVATELEVNRVCFKGEYIGPLVALFVEYYQPEHTDAWDKERTENK